MLVLGPSNGRCFEVQNIKGSRQAISLLADLARGDTRTSALISSRYTMLSSARISSRYSTKARKLIAIRTYPLTIRQQGDNNRPSMVLCCGAAETTMLYVLSDVSCEYPAPLRAVSRGAYQAQTANHCSKYAGGRWCGVLRWFTQ